MRKKTVSTLQLVLTLAFVTCLVVSNIITAKQVLLPLGIVMTGGVFVFPFTYILSDVFSEVYGYKWSRFTCYLAFAANLFAVIVFSFTIATPGPEYWTGQEAFATVLGSTPRVLFASMLAFLVGDYVNDRVFKALKDKHPEDHKGFGFRAILSSLCGEFIDSMIFIPIVFLGEMPLAMLAQMAAFEIIIKTSYEVIILPLTRAVVHAVGKYEIKGVTCNDYS